MCVCVICCLKRGITLLCYYVARVVLCSRYRYANSLRASHCRWDRTAYLSDVKYGTPSYTAQMNNIQNNFVIANYVRSLLRL